MSEIKAIETRYKGYRFRSRLEARWAVFFDSLSVKWEYECEGYETEYGRYLPDFVVTGTDGAKWFVEIKPDDIAAVGEQKCIYLAGKMCSDREADMNGHFVTGPDDELSHDSHSFHADAVDSCLRGVRSCDVFFAFFETADAHGTLIEMGYAKALNKPIFSGFNYTLGNPWTGEPYHGSGCFSLWFAKEISSEICQADSMRGLVNAFLPLTTAEKKCKAVSAIHHSIIIAGDPTEHRATAFCGHVHRCHYVPNLLFPGIKPADVAATARNARAARFEHNS